ncbi:hypothetical protein [Altererythrobacter fulvus]|uniref:hypothetical protein n=1 Tax=Caenibius fulvus TaxID=2126012 RepID=UPI0030181E12
MIIRIWEGRVPNYKSPEYLRLLREETLQDYREAPGNRGAWCLHRHEGEITRIRLVSHWESWEAVRLFAGEEIERARSYDFDRDFLIEVSDTVEHWEMQDGRSISATTNLTRGA